MICKTVFELLLAAAMIGMTSSVGVIKRSDDADPYAAIISTHAQELASLQARLQAVENRLAKQASFRVLLNKPVTANAPILFDQLVFTVGGAQYDPHTGIYTVATPGVYQFGFQLFPSFMKEVLIDMYTNGNIQTRSRCYDSSVYPTSCSSSSFFHLQQGDKVWLQANQAGEYYNGVHSFFSGALISADP